MPNPDNPKLCTSRAGRDLERIHVLLDRRSRVAIGQSQVAYADILGRPASISLLVRRGLDLLVKHLNSLDTPKKLAGEAAHLLLVIR